MPAPTEVASPFAYAVVRVVPDLARGEFVNAGVVLFARQQGFLAVRTQLDEARLAAIAPSFDVAVARSALDAYSRVANGDPEAGAVAQLDQSERFGWLVAPSSTILQTSPVHTGIIDDPQAQLDELFLRLVVGE